MEMFSFQRPGPGGTTSGIETQNRTEQCSEKGQGAISQDDTDETQGYGQPTRSIREAK